MKTTCLLAFFLFSAIHLSGQWAVKTTGNGQTLHALYFTSPEIGYAAGDNGVILKTIDGGETWSALTTGTHTRFTSIVFINADTGFAAGGDVSRGHIFKTTTAGLYWTEVSTDYLGILVNSLRFCNNTTGYAIGRNYVLKTTDAGSHWTLLQNLSHWCYGNSIFFTSPDTGYIAGDSLGAYGTTFKTTNGGTSWKRVTPFYSQILRDVVFVNADTGYVVGDGGRALKTTNAGSSWTSMNTGTMSIEHLFFLDTNFGYAISVSGFIKTTNGGASWSAVNTSLRGPHSVYFVNSCLGFMGLVEGDIAKTPTVPAILPIDSGSFCQGDSLLLTVSDGEASYLWSPGGATTKSIYATSADTFSVTAVDLNNCPRITASKQISVRPLPGVPTISFSGGILISSSDSGNQWFLNGNYVSAGQLYPPAQNGEYTVKVLDGSGCSSLSAPYQVTGVGITGIFPEDNIRLYPSPSTGNIYFDGLRKNYTIEIYNPLGQTVYSAETGTGIHQVNLGKAAKGVYFYRLTDKRKTEKQGKFILE